MHSSVLLPQMQRPARMRWDGHVLGLQPRDVGPLQEGGRGRQSGGHRRPRSSVPATAAFRRARSTSGRLAFAFQIYCDFSGYTDIARGVARIMGFRLMDNFKQPYFATSIADFWRRWHISLSTWLRDYLYIPLGGNRQRHGQDLPQPLPDHAARRPLARRRVDLRDLGGLPGSAARSWSAPSAADRRSSTSSTRRTPGARVALDRPRARDLPLRLPRAGSSSVARTSTPSGPWRGTSWTSQDGSACRAHWPGQAALLHRARSCVDGARPVLRRATSRSSSTRPLARARRHLPGRDSTSSSSSGRFESNAFIYFQF